MGAACAPSPTLPPVSPRAPSPPAPPQPRSVLPERGRAGCRVQGSGKGAPGTEPGGSWGGECGGGAPEAARCLPADVPTCSARPAPPFPQVPPFPSGCRSRRLSRLPGVTQTAPKDGNGETEARCPQEPGKQNWVGGKGQEDVPQPQEVPRGRQCWSHVASRPTPPARKGNVLWNWKKKRLPASPGPASSSARPCVSRDSAGAPPPPQFPRWHLGCVTRMVAARSPSWHHRLRRRKLRQRRGPGAGSVVQGNTCWGEGAVPAPPASPVPPPGQHRSSPGLRARL